MKLTRITAGYCPVCRKATLFWGTGYWYRDQYKCVMCRSIPRQRAISKTIQDLLSNNPNALIHEFSPSGATFRYYSKFYKNYSYSFFSLEHERGAMLSNGGSCQDLHALTFEDESFDMIISQDVFEHVLDIEKAYKEIERVLKPGGVHVFTVPIDFHKKSFQRAEYRTGVIIYKEEPAYHKQPEDENGCLVTWDYGYDFLKLLQEISKKCTHNIITFPNNEENYHYGIEGDFLEVCVSKKRTEG